MTRIWFSPAIISFVQIICFSSLVVFSIYIFNRAGIPKKILIPIVFFVGLLPVNSSFSIFLTKDTMYSYSVVFLTILMYAAFFVSKVFATKKKRMIYATCFTASIVGTSLFRHNGLPVAVLALVAMIISMKLYRLFFIKISILSSILYLLITLVVYNAIDVKKSNKKFLLCTNLLHTVAAHKVARTPMTSEETKFLQSIIKDDNMWLYKKNRIVIAAGYNLYLLNNPKNSDRFIKLVLKLYWRNPVVVIKVLLNSARPLWDTSYRTINPVSSIQIVNKNVISNTDTHLPQMGGHHKELRTNSFFPQLLLPFAKFLNHVTIGNYHLLTSHWFWLFSLVLTTTIYALLKFSLIPLVIISPLLTHIVFCISTVLSYDYRYYYPIFLAATFFVPILSYMSFAKIRKDVDFPIV